MTAPARIIGRRVANYQIKSLLGEGGMGAVYLAEHDTLDAKLAIKVLHPQFATHEEIVRRFAGEARAASQTKHPNIIRVIDFGQFDSGQHYIALEYLEGHSLDRQPIPMELGPLLLIAVQVCGGLSAAHARGIIHRDLKPANLFLSPEPNNPWNTKILDFGIAKLIGDTAIGGVHTGTHVVMGSPAYMSPEQARGSANVTTLSDIFSMGAILFELACGRKPYLATTIGDIVHAQHTQPTPDPAALRSDLPDGWRDIIRGCLSIDPGSRPQSADDLAELLVAATPGGAELAFSIGFVSTKAAHLPDENAAHTLRAQGSPTTLSSAASVKRSLGPNPPKTRRHYVVGAALVALLASVGVGAALVNRSGSASTPGGVAGAPGGAADATHVGAGRQAADAGRVVDAGLATDAGAALDARSVTKRQRKPSNRGPRRSDTSAAPTPRRSKDTPSKAKPTLRKAKPKPKPKPHSWEVPEGDEPFRLKGNP